MNQGWLHRRSLTVIMTMRQRDEPLTSEYTVSWAFMAQAKTINAIIELSRALMRSAKMMGCPSWRNPLDICILNYAYSDLAD